MITEIITKHREFTFGFTVGLGSSLILIVFLLLLSEFIAWLTVRKTKPAVHTQPTSQGGPNSQSWRR